MATSGGVRSWSASTPVPKSSDGAAAPGRSEQGERLGAVRLGHPERAVAELFRTASHLDAALHAEGPEAGVGHSEGRMR